MRKPSEELREYAVTTIGHQLEREGSPRLTITLLLFITGLFGFLASVVLLKLGMNAMWLRYPLAVVVAYVAFLFMLRIWAGKLSRVLRLEQLRALEAAGELPPSGRRKRESGSGWQDWLSIPDMGMDVDEGCLPLIALAVLIGAGAALFAIVFAAPVLMAEVILDIVLVAALYKRLRGIERHHWFVSAVRRTWLPALCTAGGLALAGWVMHESVPEASSIGPVFERLAK
jgi:hypothetical protein